MSKVKLKRAKFQGSQKSKDRILVDENKFEYNYTTCIARTTYWGCRTKKGTKCKARAATISDGIDTFIKWIKVFYLF